MKAPRILVFVLMLIGAAVGANAQNTVTYRIPNVLDVLTRSAIAATGANIIEVGRDYVVAEATPDEARAGSSDPRLRRS